MFRVVLPVRLVLLRPRNADNLGAVARAMKNFGLSEWTLVAPNPLLLEERSATLKLAVGAQDLIESMRLEPTLEEAVADCAWVVGTTMRKVPGRLRLTPRQFAATASKRAAGGQVALIFGDERSGMTNADLAVCHELSAIPSHRDQPSLNLAQAALVYCYELRLAQLGEAQPSAAPRPRAAEGRDLARVEERLRDTLRGNGFLQADERHAVKDLLGSLQRSQLTLAEARLWEAALRGRPAGKKAGQP